MYMVEPFKATGGPVRAVSAASSRSRSGPVIDQIAATRDGVVLARFLKAVDLYRGLGGGDRHANENS